MSPRGRIAFLVLSVASLGAGPPRLYRNAELGVLHFEPPPGWERAPQASYPRLLVSYSLINGARLNLTAERLAEKRSTVELAAMSRTSLEHQGFTKIKVLPEAQRTLLSAKLDHERKVAFQAYLVASGIAYVVTLIGPAGQRASLEHDFDETLRTFEFGHEDGGQE
jgi:hypothetical protein